MSEHKTTFFHLSNYTTVCLLVPTRGFTQTGQAPKVSPGRRLRTGPGHGRLVPAQRRAEPKANGRGCRYPERGDHELAEARPT